MGSRHTSESCFGGASGGQTSRSALHHLKQFGSAARTVETVKVKVAPIIEWKCILMVQEGESCVERMGDHLRGCLPSYMEASVGLSCPDKEYSARDVPQEIQ